MKKIAIAVIALFLAANVGAAAVDVALAQQIPRAVTAPARSGIIALNHASATTAGNTMQKAIDNAVARAAAEKAAQEEAARQVAAQQQVSQSVGNSGSGSGSGSGGGSDGATATASGGGEDLWACLASFGVSDTSIAYGDTHGYEAISYYKTGYIVINPNHTYSLYTLVAHEINHIVAYRESGKTTEN